MKVSLITTFKNEEKGIGDFLGSVFSQSRLPDELVMVDGGSTDGTIGLVEAYPRGKIPARLILEAGCNISRGRNRAIEAAAHDVIAVTDAGCILETNWLEELVGPMERDPEIDVVAGIYTVESAGVWERLTSAYLMPFPDRVCRDMPSGRSTGFRKAAWKRAGGYPEWLDHAEDSYFALQLKKSGCRFFFSPKASVRWRPRSTPRSFLVQYYRYAVGDGRAGLFKRTYLPKILLFCLLALLAAAGPPAGALVLAVSYLAARTAAFCFRGRERRLVLLLPAVIILHDLAQVSGFVAGTITGPGRK